MISEIQHCIDKINQHESKKGSMYEDLYNTLQQIAPIVDDIQK